MSGLPQAQEYNQVGSHSMTYQALVASSAPPPPAAVGLSHTQSSPRPVAPLQYSRAASHRLPTGHRYYPDAPGDQPFGGLPVSLHERKRNGPWALEKKFWIDIFTKKRQAFKLSNSLIQDRANQFSSLCWLYMYKRKVARMMLKSGLWWKHDQTWHPNLPFLMSPVSPSSPPPFLLHNTVLTGSSWLPTTHFPPYLWNPRGQPGQSGVHRTAGAAVLWGHSRCSRRHRTTHGSWQVVWN